MIEQQPSNGGKLDAANPYFLHHFDHPGMVLVSKSLNWDNYSIWYRAMTISLNAKSKLGFIDGTTTMPSATAKPNDYASWKKCNDMILFWILNSLTQDLVDSVIFSTTTQEMTVAAYYTRLKKLWDELGSYNDTVCSCAADHKRRRLMQFLMGLNKSYSAIRGQILLMNPLLDIAKAYSSIIQEEKQRSLGVAYERTKNSSMVVRRVELVALAGKGTTQSANPKANVASSVAMPSGEQALITSIGNLPLNSAVTLKNVLGVPSFKDLTTRTTIGLGEQRDELYYLVALVSEKPKPQTPSAAATSCRSPSSQSNNACDVCALAKQSRLPFSVSSMLSVRPFDLIHCDIWGPYKIASLSGAKYFFTIVDDYSRFTWSIPSTSSNSTPVIPLFVSDPSPPVQQPSPPEPISPAQQPLPPNVASPQPSPTSPPPEPILRCSQRPHHPPMALRDFFCNQVTCPNHLPPLSSSP
ncbi:uncharacterized protein LOC116114962 [Pistacia vera]|uniref:uncharacterized protein LOC116114962 n=1 Tax=Pistacia vera TaxID=55513 RepID=UPI001262F8F4|nr:uncharacterized protein LOC116114962 [Pistacia vera]